MKRIFVTMLGLLVALSICACDEEEPSGFFNEDMQSLLQSDSNIEAEEKAETKFKVETKRQDETENKDETEDHSVVGTVAESPQTNELLSLDELEDSLAEYFEKTITSLENEWDSLKGKVDSFDAYTYCADEIEDFYDEINDASEQMCIMMYEYALKYADTIMVTYEDADDMYDAFDEIYDNVYDDAGDDLYDDIYDGILDDMYDSFYDGVLDDAYDTVPYGEWSDVRSDEYDWWSDTRSDVYDNWSDTRSDIYDFWSDVRSDLWDDDIDDAKERIEDFREDVLKMK